MSGYDEKCPAGMWVDGFWYLATPYSKYPGGIKKAWEMACGIAAWFIRQGVHVYCPIAHTHPIAIHGALDPYDHDLWMALDEKMMAQAHGLIVAQMDGWQRSHGIGLETAYFEKAGKPVRYLAMEDTW